MKRVLVTGANGFIGTALCKRLLSDGWEVTAIVRQSAPAIVHSRLRTVAIGNIDEKTNWTRHLDGIDIVVHLAARVHVMADDALDPIQSYRAVNVHGTTTLAENASLAGVHRFVFMSTVKVNGEECTDAYHEHNEPLPEDPYGISKMEAENQLKIIAGESKLAYTIIRPPLVYGPEVKANFLALMELVNRRIPLPLAAVQNRRSLIYLGNLVDCIITCMTHPAAAGQTYLASDGQDVGTPELIRSIAAALNTPCRLFPIPQSLLRWAGIILGKKDSVKRLIDSLTVDISKIKHDLAWSPPFSMAAGLRQTAKWFKKR